MKTIKSISFLCLGLFFACQSNHKNVLVLQLDNSSMTVCDESKVKEKRETKLSELVEDFQIIRFENKEEAFFKPWWLYFSDNYICVRQDGKVVKLFDKSGKFITNVGGIGQGPGEYKFVTDIAIDEKGKSIYITQIVGKSIWKYDIDGNFLKEINLGAQLNKPRLFIQPDSVLSLVHLCFKDRNDKFTAANIRSHNKDSIQYLYTEELAGNMKNEKGVITGYDNEIWAYRNCPDFSFMMTHTDTLYHYNSKKNEIRACFTMTMDPDKKAGSLFIFNEFPHHYFVSIIGESGKNILVDKEKQEAFETTIVNDFMGNMEVYPKFQDGYYFCTYEPIELKEKIEEHLTSGNCPEDQADKLKTLQQTLKENDNNILLLGKLKK